MGEIGRAPVTGLVCIKRDEDTPHPQPLDEGRLDRPSSRSCRTRRPHAQQRMVAAEIGHDKPPSADLITMLVASLSDHRDHLRATAIVADVRVPEIDSDAVRVVLEHRESPHLAVLLPYKRRRLGRGFHFGQLQAATALPQAW